VLAACGGDESETSLTEYVDLINAAVIDAIERADQLTAQGILSGDDLTPQQIQAGLQLAVSEIRAPLQETADGIDPPEQVASLHALLWDWHADLMRIETELSARLGATPDTEAGWTELSDSPEVVAYRATLAEGKQVCTDFQAELDSTAASGAFEDVAWFPSEFSEAVNAALGCDQFPEDPSTVYRYPPP
jgi:hypothetical protein